MNNKHSHTHKHTHIYTQLNPEKLNFRVNIQHMSFRYKYLSTENHGVLLLLISDGLSQQGGYN